MPFHDPSSGPVSASPSPTTAVTTRSGLSNAAPNACVSTYPSSPPSWMETRHRWTHMARYAVRGGELPEEQLHPLAVTGDVWIDLAPSALQPDVRDQGWASVSRSCE